MANILRQRMRIIFVIHDGSNEVSGLYVPPELCGGPMTETDGIGPKSAKHDVRSPRADVIAF